jgi:hypothetical protein
MQYGVVVVGATWKKPVTLDLGTRSVPRSEWTLVDTRQPIDALRLATPGSGITGSCCSGPRDTAT